jgi:tryptophan 2,3-dioxygenase
MPTVPTYWDYLRLDSLLDLQGGLEGDEDALVPDELHFIIVHQTFELWFKLVIRSIRLARDELGADQVAEATVPHVAHHLRRASAILKLGVHQFEVMETLTPQDFLSFRDKLVPSSGFQSFQMRELEILLGLDESKRILYGKVDPLEHIKNLAEKSPGGAMAWGAIQQAREETDLLTCLNDWLYRTPIQGSSPGDAGDDEAVADFVDEYLDAASASLDVNLARLVETMGVGRTEEVEQRFQSIRDASRGFMNADDVVDEYKKKARRVRAAVLFIESYRRLPLLAWPRLLLDVVVELEEQMLLWRHRHVRMVERVIGRRVGTGGSSGVDYLDKTVQYRIYRDLWSIRTVLLPADKLPPLKNPAFYGFAE